MHANDNLCTTLFLPYIKLFTEDFDDKFSIIISGHKIFKYVKFLSNLDLTGTIDGVNITDLKNSVVTLSTDQNLTSHLNFTGGISIAGDLIVSENRTIDGVDVSDDLVYRDGDSDQFVGGTKEFKIISTYDVNVSKDVECESIDGVVVLELFKNRVTLTTDQNITVPWNLGNNTIKELVIKGNINGVNFTDFINDIMSTTKDQWVTGSKQFLGESYCSIFTLFLLCFLNLKPH